MTNQIKKVKSNYHHEIGVRPVVVTKEKFAEMAEYGFDTELAYLFLQAVNWIARNNNKSKTMLFYKKNTPLVEGGLADIVTYKGMEYLRLTKKGYNILNGVKTKLATHFARRKKTGVESSYRATNEIHPTVQKMIESLNGKVRSTLLKPQHLQVRVKLPIRSCYFYIYQNDVKVVFDGRYKKALCHDLVAKLGDKVVNYQDYGVAITFVTVSLDDFATLDPSVFDFTGVKKDEELFK